MESYHGSNGKDENRLRRVTQKLEMATARTYVCTQEITTTKEWDFGTKAGYTERIEKP